MNLLNQWDKWKFRLTVGVIALTVGGPMIPPAVYEYAIVSLWCIWNKEVCKLKH